MPLAIGARVGPFTIEAPLGSGGMGEVYRARDTKLNRDVAIKVLPEHFVADPGRTARFQREAQVLAALNHPNIAQIYGLEDGALVMELVDGEDLSVVIARGPIAVREALAIARQVADALAAAHEAGIIHRDLKPANVKVRDDGTVKVLDFGLAKALTEGTEAEGGRGAGVTESPTLTARMTQMGMIIGTAAYMAPEQARGKTVDRRADLWAFGVVLYEMLTGRRAFEGAEVSDVLASVLKESPSLDALPADVPRSVRRLLRRTLEKDRAKRLDSMAAARLELDEAVDNAHQIAAPAAAPPPRPRRIVLPLVAVAIATGLIVGAGVWSTMQPAAPEVRRVTVTAPADLPVEIETNHADLAITPDGRRFLYFSAVGTTQQFVLRPFDRFDGVALTKLGDRARGVFMSFDGAWIGFQTGPPGGADNYLSKVPIDGGAPVPICAVESNVRGASWMADDTIVFATNGSAAGLLRVSASGGKPEMLTTPVEKDGEIDHLWPHAMPDGQHLLFSIMRREGESDIALLSLATRTWRVIVKDGTSPRYAATGHIVYGRAGTIRAVRFDAGALEVRGDPIEVQSGVITKASGAADFAVSATGTLVYLPGETPTEAQQLVWRDRSGRDTPTKVAPLSQPYRALRLSPDGRFAAGVIGDRADPDADSLWLIDLVRESASRLTPPARRASNPAWSPDGKYIAFWSSSIGTGSDAAGMFRVAASGATPPERLTTAVRGSERQLPGGWTADMRTFLFTHFEGGKPGEIHQLTLTPTPVTTPLLAGPTNHAAPALSPDGRWLAYQANSDIGGRPDVFVRPFPNVNDQRIPVSTDGGNGATWSRDGAQLFYQSGSGAGRGGRGGGGQIVVTKVTGMGTRTLTFSRPEPFGVRADGQLMAYPPDGDRVLVAARPSSLITKANEYRVIFNWFEELKARVK
jgi:hypothetical protein